MALVSHITRRNFVAGAASVPIIAVGANGLLSPVTQAHAKAEMKGPGGAIFSRVKLGGFEVTTLLDSQRTFGNPQNVFGKNVSAEEFEKASIENLIPADKTQFYFTPTVVNTGNELVLFDTGLGGENGNITGALQAAGYTPDQIDVVVLTHMHPDHIGGLATAGKPTFPNARYVTGTTEYDFWTSGSKEEGIGKMLATNLTPHAEKITFVKDGDSVVSGITAMSAFGHTPGHMIFHLESEGKQLLLTADLANHYVWSLAYPDWEVKFDSDKQAAAASRRKILGMLATDKIPFIGYHMPFPATGYVEVRGNGFHYIPASYQLLL